VVLIQATPKAQAQAVNGFAQKLVNAVIEFKLEDQSQRRRIQLRRRFFMLV